MEIAEWLNAGLWFTSLGAAITIISLIARWRVAALNDILAHVRRSRAELRQQLSECEKSLEHHKTEAESCRQQLTTWQTLARMAVRDKKLSVLSEFIETNGE